MVSYFLRLTLLIFPVQFPITPFYKKLGRGTNHVRKNVQRGGDEPISR